MVLHAKTKFSMISRIKLWLLKNSCMLFDEKVPKSVFLCKVIQQTWTHNKSDPYHINRDIQTSVSSRICSKIHYL